jgi:hypothetical protein
VPLDTKLNIQTIIEALRKEFLSSENRMTLSSPRTFNNFKVTGRIVPLTF